MPLDTSDGLVLDGELVAPDDAPWGAAVVCHPHPLYGGDMRNNVVEALVRGFASAGLAALRFDFRGVGRSGGEHGGGVDERLDALAALEAVAPLAGDGPVMLAGYSFGADVALAVDDPRLTAWVTVAAPLASPRLVAGPDLRPKHLFVPEHDQFRPPAKAEEAVADWVATTLEVVPQADHFLAGASRFLAERAAAVAASWK
jgi:alpha/beta superfamily hydrolase